MAVRGFVVPPLALVHFLGGTRYVPAAEVALFALVETVLGPVWAWIGVGEEPPATSLMGGVVVVGAIAANAIVADRRRRRAALAGAG